MYMRARRMIMDIGSINNGFVNTVADNAKAATNDMSKKLKSDMSSASDKELMDACKEFEAYFIEQVFKNMKKSMVPKDESLDGSTSMLKDYYEDELWSKYASEAASQSSNGLAQMLFEQMKRNYSIMDPKSIDAAGNAAVEADPTQVDEVAQANAVSAAVSEEE
ncbi:MAG: rod-binding protein [Lachnospiraceae bacterium]|nr:rod-binding protein [Lachnospiraceae bacterium]